MQRRLAGGVGAAHHKHFLVLAGSRLHQRRAVVDAAPRKPVRARNIQLAVLHAGRQQHHVARNFAPIGQLHKPVLPVDPQARGPLGQELRAEPRSPGCAPAVPGPRR